MRLYHAKYVPVEGEIEPKDTFKHCEDGFIMFCQDKIQAELANKRKHIKVKLMLCSKDIVIGEISKDAIWVVEGSKFNEEEFQINYTLPVKIDSAARQSVQYPEFVRKPTDDDVENWYHYQFNQGRGCSWETDETVVSRVKILCPTCKTFH